MGHLSLDRGRGPDRVDHLSHHPRDFLHGFLVHLAGQRRYRGSLPKIEAVHGAGRSAAAAIRQVSVENKMYHGVIVLTGLAVILTGVFMMFRVRTVFFPRNPYLFGDMTWGMMYVLHGLAGVSLIALIMIHIYFALRPEKFVITKSMVFGSMPKEYYLEHHDTERWTVEATTSKGASA